MYIYFFLSTDYDYVHVHVQVIPSILQICPCFEAKQKLAVDSSICSKELGLVPVLQKIFEALSACNAIPQQWITFAADTSDLVAIRFGFVEGSGDVFQDKKELLEKFVALRALYATTILRDLNRLKKISFDAPVCLLISSMQVDLQNMAGSSKTEDGEFKSKPHPVTALIPGFDVLQSC